MEKMTVGQLRSAFCKRNENSRILLKSSYSKQDEQLVELTNTMCSYSGIISLPVESISMDGKNIIAEVDLEPETVLSFGTDFIGLLSTYIENSMSAAMESISKIETDKTRISTNILNAEYQLGQYSACMHILKHFNMDKFVEYGEQYSKDINKALHSIEKLYSMIK